MSDSEEEKEASSYYTNSYCNIATDFYEVFYEKKFNKINNKSNVMKTFIRPLHYLAMQLNIKPGMKVLDVGRGVGGPALEICQFTGAHITDNSLDAVYAIEATCHAPKVGRSLCPKELFVELM
ncbi:1618_t:CDS:2 [Funneliformis caledonium]|uniref:1618_t:CDS:1 n=1 Tax=Funneliformis caledonium TaxID=1117310 RepID=A0A9N8V436_9GLOM|nr:1618_t:CDS:2 [Funneliformis caledonium]